jgi:hypothetical protein
MRYKYEGILERESSMTDSNGKYHNNNIIICNIHPLEVTTTIDAAIFTGQ